jgi:hypothetical protein
LQHADAMHACYIKTKNFKRNQETRFYRTRKIMKKINLIAFSLVTTLSCADEDFKNNNEIDIIKNQLSEVFNHPLKNVNLINGQVPGVDYHYDPSGKVYSIYESIIQIDENEEVLNTRGVTLLDEDLSELEPEYLERKEIPVISTKLKIDPELYLTIKNDNGKHNVIIRILENEIEYPQIKLERYIGLGLIQTETDYDNIYEEILLNRRNELNAIKIPILSYLIWILMMYFIRI